MIRALPRRLRRFLSREEGGVTVEFLIIMPVLFGFVVNSAEAGTVMLRGAFLEWGLNSAVRDMRLGNLVDADGNHDPELFRERLCETVWILGDYDDGCKDNIEIEVRKFSPASVAAMNAETRCKPGGDEIPPPAIYNPGAETELTVVRVCASIPAITPRFGLGAALPKNGDGDYHLVAMNAYTTEPT